MGTSNRIVRTRMLARTALGLMTPDGAALSIFLRSALTAEVDHNAGDMKCPLFVKKSRNLISKTVYGSDQ
nr:unnamed protein product [Callosobruchus analis]